MIENIQFDHFKEHGFLHLHDVFNSGQLASFSEAIVELFRQQYEKIGDYRTDERIWKPTLNSILSIMEAHDKEALYQVQKMLCVSQEVRALFNRKFMSFCSELLGSRINTTLLDGPALFVNKPNTQRLLYKWHSEAHYYPKRRRFLNVWFPLFEPKTRDNGAMTLLPGSHKRDFPFAEYKGFNKDTENKANHFVQYEIPENFVAGYDRYVCESVPGDVILFDRALVHRSNENHSPDFSFAIVARVWDPSQDLTLSGNMAATPYGGDIGRANLVVEP